MARSAPALRPSDTCPRERLRTLVSAMAHVGTRRPMDEAEMRLLHEATRDALAPRARADDARARLRRLVERYGEPSVLPAPAEPTHERNAA